jgi:hypothetical protein
MTTNSSRFRHFDFTHRPGRRGIGPIETLGDDVFELHMADVLAEARTVADHIVAEHQAGRLVLEQRFQTRLALHQQKGGVRSAVVVE